MKVLPVREGEWAPPLSLHLRDSSKRTYTVGEARCAYFPESYRVAAVLEPERFRGGCPFGGPIMGLSHSDVIFGRVL